MILLLVIITFLKRLSTLHSLLIHSVRKDKLLDKIEELKRFILLEKNSIKKEMTKHVIKKAKNKTLRNKIITSQNGLIKNALNLFAKRTLSVIHGNLE